MLSSLYDVLVNIYDTDFPWLVLYIQVLSVVILTGLLIAFICFLFKILLSPFKIFDIDDDEKPSKSKRKKMKKSDVI